MLITIVVVILLARMHIVGVCRRMAEDDAASDIATMIGCCVALFYVLFATQQYRQRRKNKASKLQVSKSCAG
jgi:glucose-6-phosphate-specific signal transduction histidine kinase